MSTNSRLDQISIEVPCNEPWEGMHGDERSRYCTRCRQRVYNISAMRLDEALAIIDSSKPRCVRFFRRPDGTVTTKNCRALLRTARRKLGFELLGSADFEYPKGMLSPHNIWRLVLSAWSPPA